MANHRAPVVSALISAPDATRIPMGGVPVPPPITLGNRSATAKASPNPTSILVSADRGTFDDPPAAESGRGGTPNANLSAIGGWLAGTPPPPSAEEGERSEEHTSELQSREKLVCR